MKNQRVTEYNASRLFERGKFEIVRLNGKGTIVTKPNTTRKFCVELANRAWGVGTPVEVNKVGTEGQVNA